MLLPKKINLYIGYYSLFWQSFVLSWENSVKTEEKSTNRIEEITCEVKGSLETGGWAQI